MTSPKRLLQLRFLIIAAAIWHMAIAVAVFAVARYQLLPSRFYPSGLFAPDETAYEWQCVHLAELLKSEGLAAWATWPTQLHLRLYSLPLVLIPRRFGFNILMIEPLNLFYYLAVLVLVFKLGEAVFDYRSALIATVIVAVWPTFLLHSTQLLRDPLLILAVVGFSWSVVETLGRRVGLIPGLLLGILTTAAVVVIRIVRLPMWYLICAAAGTTVLLLVVRACREKHVDRGAVVFAILIIAAVLVTPRFQPYFHNQQELGARRINSHEDVQKLSLQDQIATTRRGFDLKIDEKGNVIAAEEGSRIDSDLRVQGWRDLVWHVPRALEVGFLAPFPNMWLQTGQLVGFSGRLVAGIETLLAYVIECLALFGLWRARRELAAWFLTVFIVLGALALGLAVNNIGALYRLRYPFWILLIILGAGGIDQVRRLVLKSRREASV